ncbi:MAG: alpha/beta hydrolase, partial [Fibrobacter sp.]|nr:alpha/beta hydrolase [Fibrobacter sp.]
SNAEDFVHHAPDYDHPTPYYGQQQLDKEGNYIFVAPRGDTDGMPWSMTSDKDHKFFDQLLTTMEDNYCIDTTRVFVTGFSFGAMYTNSLAWDMQHRIRAVAVYAPVAEVIYLPKNAGKPIAWMAVHGKRDGTCQYSHDLQSTLPAILKNNGKASDGDSQFTDASGEKPEEFNGTAGHLCYDFKTVDERFPVKFCSWNGEHQWTAHDGGNTGVGQGWQNTWVPEEAHKFFEQF